MDENFKPQIFTVIPLHGFILLMELISCPYEIHIGQIVGGIPPTLTDHTPYHIKNIVHFYLYFFLCTKNIKLMSINYLYFLLNGKITHYLPFSGVKCFSVSNISSAGKDKYSMLYNFECNLCLCYSKM
jgi:hypothetical protein